MAEPLRIAYFSPLPPARSGVADYSAELLPHLARRASVTLFAEDAAASGRLGLPVRPLDAYPAERERYDLALYHMGNSAHHVRIYEMLIRYPGVVVLHDYVLHHFLAHTTAGQGNYAAYTRELGFALGREGIALAADIRAGRRPHPLAELPLHNRLLTVSLGLIVHSRFAAAGLQAQRPSRPVRVIPHQMSPAGGRSRRVELPVGDETVIFACAGQITANKQIPLALRAFRRLLEKQPDAHYLIAGEPLPEVALAAVVDELGLGGRVTCLGYVETVEELTDWIATADVVVNLRHPTLGETSGTALRALAVGRPLIVFDVGWYAEIPDDAALKVPVMDEAALAAAMERTAASIALRRELGAAGRRYVAEVCSPVAAAGAYVTFLEEMRGRWRRGE